MMPGFVQRLAHGPAVPSDGDDVEHIAMIAALRIGPFAGLAAPIGGRDQAHIEASPRCVVNVADQPVAAFPVPVGQVAATDALRIPGATFGNDGCGALPLGAPQAALRAERRPTGYRSSPRYSPPAPTPPPRPH